jgi:hypothetical protein
VRIILTQIVFTLTALLFSGCRITQNVTPVEPGVPIRKVYVLENDKVLMEGFLGELLKQIRDNGIDAETYTGRRAVDAKHHVTYTANWAWDMAMYLTYFHITLYEGDRVLGEAEYDAQHGGANMSKFGKTKDKIRPLLQELFGNVSRNK